MITKVKPHYGDLFTARPVSNNPWNIFDELFGTSPGLNTIQNDDGSLSVSLDVPGIKESDLSVKVLDGMITVSGQTKTTNSQRSIHKSFSIPENFDQENVKAELADGVLTLTFVNTVQPVKEAKTIPVSSQK